MASGSGSSRAKCFYEEWLGLQEQELSELQQVAARHAEGHDTNDAESIHVIEKTLKNFEEYVEKRRLMIRSDALPLCAPPWSTSLENSLNWVGGCRPSSFIRLVYALCGLDIESNMDEFLQGEETGSLGDISAGQVSLINKLQEETISKERKLSEKMASLQERILDRPFADVGWKNDRDFGGNTRSVAEGVEKHGQAMGALLAEADLLRLNTLRELVMHILTPIQAVHFLTAGKKLRLCVREWGLQRDREHRSN